MACELYPDFKLPPLPGESDPDYQRALENRDRVKRFYGTLRAIVGDRFNFVLDGIPEDVEQFGTVKLDKPVVGDAEAEKRRVTALLHQVGFVSVAGMLLADNLRDPTLGKVGSFGPEDFQSNHGGKPFQAVSRYVDEVVDAVQRFNRSAPLFQSVFAILKLRGKSPNATAPSIFPRQVAEITERLVDQRIGADDPMLQTHVDNLLAVVLGDSTQARASAVDIDLPDLEEGTSASVISDNVNALAAVYYAAMLEEYKFFASGGKVIEHFVSGLLPLSRGPGGNAIYQIMRRSTDRLTESERRSLYARSFGIAGGSVEVELPNREFGDLWVRFLSAVSVGVRQSTNETTKVNLEQAFKAGRDLAVNLSMHGYGMAHFAAVELQETIREYLEMMNYADVQSAYGVRDRWQLVERVSTLYVGGPVNGVRQRTMAQAGGKIIQWLGQRAAILSNPYPTPEFGRGRSDGRLEFDGDLVPNVERWLAVTGTADTAVEKYSEPVAVPQQPTIPTLTLAAMPGVDGALRRVANMVPNIVS